MTTTDTEGHEVTTYTFTANTDTKVEINPAAKKTYTITLPSGNGFYALFKDSNKAEAKNAMSYTFEYGDWFTIQFVAQAGMEAKLFVNGKEDLSLTDGGTATCEDTHGTTDTPKHEVKGDYYISAFAMQKVFHTVTYVLEPYSGLYTVQNVEPWTFDLRTGGAEDSRIQIRGLVQRRVLRRGNRMGLHRGQGKRQDPEHDHQ